MDHLNSFQEWAASYAARFGLISSPVANWVTLTAKDGTQYECMTQIGVKAACRDAAPDTAP